MPTGFDSILRSLGQQDRILPYLEAAMISAEWPPSYSVEIDSSPYYGKGDGYFHPSTHPLMNESQLYYMFHPDHQEELATERSSMQQQMTMSMGTALGAIVATQMQMAGIVRPENVELEYVNHEHHVRGRVDFVVDHPDGSVIPVEMKTVNTFTFNKLEGVKPSWDAQLSLALDAVGQEEGILLAMQSGWPYQLREFPVRKNKTLLSQVYAKFDHVRECIEQNTPPYQCCGLESVEAKSCSVRFLCKKRDHG